MIICADDFGLRDDINRSILDLVGRGALSAVSCLVLLQRCRQEDLEPLLAVRDSVDIGLHLCFTDEGLPLERPQAESPVALPPYQVLLRRALTRRIDPASVARRIADQLDLFSQKCGRHPDFIDGHLHTHQLPVVRDALVRFVSELPARNRPYIRNTSASIGGIRSRGLPWVKAAGIGWFGGTLQRRLRAAGIATNDGFAGVYDFSDCARYREYLPRFASLLSQENGILVTHPGEHDDWRRCEAEALRQLPFAPGRVNRFRR